MTVQRLCRHPDHGWRRRALLSLKYSHRSPQAKLVRRLSVVETKMALLCDRAVVLHSAQKIVKTTAAMYRFTASARERGWHRSCEINKKTRLGGLACDE
jgi:hypothetical protein